MEKVSVFEEYRLIERSEAEINGAWKVAHLVLFFMAFVFGSFCTFCFYMLMYLFDEKCVLFPKLMSLTTVRHDSLPMDEVSSDILPLDLLGTQWMENSACHLPTYVPLISGIFGLVWITMFLMCSTGSRALTGLQSPWRVLPPLFMFSLAMASLCIYSSAVTHSGLDELCFKLSEITGSSTCAYTVNVATPGHERHIRGVHQAVRLTIICAWLHTACWILSALLTLARVGLIVDFQLVRVSAQLIGDIDKMMEHHEKQIRIVSPDVWFHDERSSTSLPKQSFIETQKPSSTQQAPRATPRNTEDAIDVLYVAPIKKHFSSVSLLPEESNRLARKRAYKNTQKDHKFIVDIAYDLLQQLPDSKITPYNSGESSFSDLAQKLFLQNSSATSAVDTNNTFQKLRSPESVSPKTVMSQIGLHDAQEPLGSTFQNTRRFSTQKNKKGKKSNLKTASTQTDKSKFISHKVLIAEMEDTEDTTTSSCSSQDEVPLTTSQFNNEKEKQD